MDGDALFVSTVVYRETVPPGDYMQEPFLHAEDPWFVRIEADIPSSRQPVHYCVDMEPLPAPEEKRASKRWSGDIGFATGRGTRINFVEVEMDLPRNAQFLPYPSNEDAYGLELVLTFGA